MIDIDEISKAFKRKRKRFVTPGMDGKVFDSFANAMSEEVQEIYRMCLPRGIFPSEWKQAELILIPKPGKKGDISPSAYRPICLISEVGKIFEKIIVNGILEHLENVGPNISHRQYGFRKGRSAIDAIDRVVSMANEIVQRRGVGLVVSLDISNAFNSLPWEKIHTSLVRHRFPGYIKRIIREYLKDRSIAYNVGIHCPLVRRKVDRGVPQGRYCGTWASIRFCMRRFRMVRRSLLMRMTQ